MNYQAALDYILSFADYERAPRSSVVFDLARIQRLLERLGHPETSARAVHVAGTKGKGSTAAMIASIMTHSGYRTGLYTSPHLLSFTERIQIDGKPIAEDVIARLTETLKPEVEYINLVSDCGTLTTFEILTALAFVYFREMQVDYQVLETGLGGRLDATNVVKPEVCVITSISYDHTDVLGNTLAQIATEKAGIIKSGVTVVCAPQFPEAMSVIDAACRTRGAKLVRVDGMAWRKQASSAEGQSFELSTPGGQYGLRIPLLGEYQMENAAAAVAAAEALALRGAKITSESIAAGLANVKWPGRLQILRRKPWVVIDGAHNAYSAKRLAEALRQYFDFKRAILILGASSDKDVCGMVTELTSLTDEVIATSSRHPRALPPERLSREFSKLGKNTRTAENVEAALKLAQSLATTDDLICATGSIFIIAEVLEYLDKAG